MIVRWSTTVTHLCTPQNGINQRRALLFFGLMETTNEGAGMRRGFTYCAAEREYYMLKLKDFEKLRI